MSGENLKEQIIQTALKGYHENLPLFKHYEDELKYYEKILIDAGYDFNSKSDKNKEINGKQINGFKVPSINIEQQRITPLEQRILHILATENKEKLANDIAEIYNRLSGKNYSRKNMSSCLAKMGKRKLIVCRKLGDSIVAKQLWSLPQWNDKNGIKSEYKTEVTK